MRMGSVPNRSGNQLNRALHGSLLLSRFCLSHAAGGAALRNLQNVNGLASLGPVDLVSIGEDQPDGAHPMPSFIRRWKHFSLTDLGKTSNDTKTTASRLRRFLSASHDSVTRYHDSQIEDWLVREVRRERYDVVVIEELSLASYIHPLRKLGCEVVFDAHNVEGRLLAQMSQSRDDNDSLISRLKRFNQSYRLKLEERRAVNRADLIWACSELDSRLIQEAYGKPATVVPNTLNVHDYQTAKVDEAFRSREVGPLTMLFVGSYGYYPNQDAANRLITEILPRVREQVPDARLNLVGRHPTAAMARAAEQDERITVTGAVDSIEPYLQIPSVIVIPLALGSGTRLKALEAFAAGLPVVSTKKGIEGIEVRDGEQVLLRETPEEIAAGVVELWRNPELRNALRERAKASVQAGYSWEVAARLIERSLDHCCRSQEQVSI